MESSLNESSGSDNKRLFNFVFYLSASCLCIFILFALLVIGRKLLKGQKTHNTQQGRVFIGTRHHASNTQTEPIRSTIYVSPANFSLPPKYETMAPPSYAEVGINYPNFHSISHPKSTALAQTSNSTDDTSVTVTNNNANIATNNNEEAVITSNTENPPTVLSVISERSPVTHSSRF